MYRIRIRVRKIRLKILKPDPVWQHWQFPGSNITVQLEEQHSRVRECTEGQLFWLCDRPNWTTILDRVDKAWKNTTGSNCISNKLELHIHSNKCNATERVSERICMKCADTALLRSQRNPRNIFLNVNALSVSLTSSCTLYSILYYVWGKIVKMLMSTGIDRIWSKLISATEWQFGKNIANL